MKSGEHTRLACWFRRLAETILDQGKFSPANYTNHGIQFRRLKCYTFCLSF
jgi:hypothetical protein